MGLRDLLLSVTPGQGPAAAAVQREKKETRRAKQEAQERQACRDRGRRAKRNTEPPKPGVNP
jgi:hypothetical protein